MKTLTVQIIQANSEDLKTLQHLGIKTFTESFGEANTAENMTLYLAQSFSDAQLKKELVDQRVQYYIAQKDGIAVAYLKLNFEDAQNENMDAPSLEIERIYVLKEFQDNNVGQLLMGKVMELAKSYKLGIVWLGVWERNPGAIRFYKRNGFVEFGEHPFMLGTDKQTDILLMLKL